MRYDTNFEQDSLETPEELSDAFETGLQGDSAFETGGSGDSETFDTEMADFESDFESDFEEEFDPQGEAFDQQEGEEESEEELGGRARRGGAGGANVQQKLNEQRAALAKLRSAVQGVGRHIRQEGGRLRFKLPARSVSDAAAKLKLDPRVVAAMLKSLRATNARAPMRRRQAEIDTEMDETAMWQEVSGACPGETKVTTHWWGTAFWFNECHTKTLLNGLSVAKDAASLCAALPIPRAQQVCKVAGPIIGIGAIAIKGIDALGGNKGIIVRQPWVVPPGLPPVVIWHQ